MPFVVSNANVRLFTKFLSARERHRLAKEAGRPVVKPDPIISQFRFCNVRRNDDRVTKWIHEHYLGKWRNDPNLWFALLVARLFNNEGTLWDLRGVTLPFKPEQMRATLHARKEDDCKNFNAAYIVSTNGRAMDKVDYVIDHVLTPAWAVRHAFARGISMQSSLDGVHKSLLQLNGVASFMAAQIVADLKYAEPKKWSDFHTFAASGPGSRRGLNRLLERDKDAPISEVAFRETLLMLRTKVNDSLRWAEPITAQDIQNCLCETYKWLRAMTGDGRPKQLYKPQEEKK
jgi:hypothetical protein